MRPTVCVGEKKIAGRKLTDTDPSFFNPPSLTDKQNTHTLAPNSLSELGG